jgi:5-(carboxyamino)imidazole ribonucleotide synthase
VPHPVTGLPVVGMVGAGQLARMTHEAALGLGLTLAVLARRPDEAAALGTPAVSLGAPDDARRLAAFAAGCDVVTFDHELVPAELVRVLAAGGSRVYPGADALAVAQDKCRMREVLGGLGLNVPAWAPVRAERDVTRFAAAHGWPLVLKRSHGGYDGRGVFFLDGPGELPVPAAEGLLIEERVAIRRELAAVVARRPSGELAGWPVVQTVQRAGICAEVIAPAPDLPDDVERAAREIARTIAVELGVVGVLAVELFDTGRDLVVNEIAVRPHNSAHWTIDGSTTSQFAQHLRAVLDWPLGDTAAREGWTVMANVLAGPDTRLEVSLPQALADPGVTVHLYGKTPRPNRKVGHVIARGEDLAETRRRAALAARRLAGGVG